jgi:hypothetical protein
MHVCFEGGSDGEESQEARQEEKAVTHRRASAFFVAVPKPWHFSPGLFYGRLGSLFLWAAAALAMASTRAEPDKGRSFLRSARLTDDSVLGFWGPFFLAILSSL